jgi:hypothetical protein
MHVTKAVWKKILQNTKTGRKNKILQKRDLLNILHMPAGLEIQANMRDLE